MLNRENKPCAAQLGNKPCAAQLGEMPVQPSWVHAYTEQLQAIPVQHSRGTNAAQHSWGMLGAAKRGVTVNLRLLSSCILNL